MLSAKWCTLSVQGLTIQEQRNSERNTGIEPTNNITSTIPNCPLLLDLYFSKQQKLRGTGMKAKLREL